MNSQPHEVNCQPQQRPCGGHPDAMLHDALWYSERGLTVIPLIPREKRPLIQWGGFQDRAQTRKDVENLWGQHPDAGIGILGGPVVFVDADTPDAAAWCRQNLPHTPWRTRTSRGIHFWFLPPPGESISCSTGNGLDVKAHGGYVVAPPSIHPSGVSYVRDFDVGTENDLLADLPPLTEDHVRAIRDYQRAAPATPGMDGRSIADGQEIDLSQYGNDTLDWSPAAEGWRNNKAASLAGRCLAEGMDLGDTVAKLQEWNQLNLPPLPATEVETTVHSIYKTHQRKKPDAVAAQTAESAQAAIEEAWPPLVPLDDFTPPLLHTSALPQCLRDFVEALAEATETPIELAAGMALATCATAASRSVRVMVEPGYWEPLNVWILAALNSGTRKSAVQSAATAPLLTWQAQQHEILLPEIRRIESDRKTKEARAQVLRKEAAQKKDAKEAEELARQVAQIEADLPEVPKPLRLWTSDATPEQLGPLLADNGECMAWLSPEGGMFDMFEGRYSNGVPNLDLLLKSHSGDSERVDRGSRPPVNLHHPRLTIGLSPQPDVLRGLASKRGFRGRGLLARFLYFLPPSPLGYRTLSSKPVPEHVKAAYAQMIRAMLEWKPLMTEWGRQQPHEVRLSSEAHAEWKKFQRAMERRMRPGGDFEHATDWAGKAPGAAARLAGILHCVEHASAGSKPWDYVISKSTMNAALELTAVIAVHSLAALGLMGADPALASARLVWDWVQNNRLPVFTISEAFNALKSRFQRAQQVKEALRVLEERGYVEILESCKTGSPGRPKSPVVLVRPEIAESWK